MRNFRLIAILFLWLPGCLPSEAADGGVNLSGVVQDPTGASIPNASLTLTPKAGGDARVGKADSGGNFIFSGVIPGIYLLKARAEHFKTTELTVAVGQEALQSVKLSMGLSTQEEKILVTAESPETGIHPESNTDSVKVEDKMLDLMPTESQQILPALTSFLAPASMGVAGPSVVIDGVETEGLDVPAWSIKHIRLNKNPYSVRYRRPGSSRVEVSTRGGTRREFRGGMSIYDRNSEFDARNAFAKTRPYVRKTLVETRLMGPIHGPSTSFFLSGERLADDENAVVNALTLNGPVVQNVAAVHNRTTLLGRIDLRRSQYHTVVAHYLYTGQTQSGVGVGGINLPEQGSNSLRVTHTFQISDRYISLKNFVNDIRLAYQVVDDRVGNPAFAPEIRVAGAFVSGPSRTHRFERRAKTSVQNTTQYYGARCSWTFGAEIHPRFIRSIDSSNFAGTYEFASLQRFENQSPYLFTINRGHPEVSFNEHEGFGFVQSDVKLRSNLELTAGARYEWHGGLAHGHVVAPRLSFAFAPHGDKTILRAGAGLFYDGYPRQIIRQSLLLDGTRLHSLVISNPAYPDALAGVVGNLPPPSVVRTAYDIGLPRLMQASFSIERAINKKTQLTVEFRTIRGKHLYRARDVNAPLPFDGLRPDQDFFTITQVESSAMMRSNSATVTLRWNAGRWMSGTAQYVLSRSMDNTDGPFGLPADNYNLRPERGRSDFDQRHRFNLMGNAWLPYRWRLGAIVLLGSGIPYNITTGHDNNHDTFATDRPFAVTRNTGLGPGLARVDVRLSRTFDTWCLFMHRKRETNSLEFSIDAFNVFNRTNFNNFIGVQSSPFFGRPNSALPGRIVQFSIRYQI